MQLLIRSTEVEMVRLSWCVSGRGGRQSVKYCFVTTKWLVRSRWYISRQYSVVLRIKLLADGSGSQREPRSQFSLFISSVEALASALIPVAVDQQADDDEEDATQHGEEHREENRQPTHPLFSLTHWKRREKEVNPEGRRIFSEE